MIQGKRAAIHQGTVVYVSGVQPNIPVRATVEAYEPNSNQWRVILQGGQFSGTARLVAEDSLKVSFALLPLSPGQIQKYVRFADDGAQGTCGRGLVVEEFVRADTPIFAEPPLIVVGGLIQPPRTHHSERFLAYNALQKYAAQELQQAQAGRGGSFEYMNVLAAFNELSVAGHVPKHVREGRDHIVSKLFGGEASKSDEVKSVLMKFHSNQFILDNLSEPTDAAFSSSGIYQTISRVNHSCDPTINIMPARVYAEQHKIEFGSTVEECGGVLMAHATRNLQKGERLTYCCGPVELQSWGLAKRREYLLAQNGFICGCERCVAEEAAEKAAAAGGMEEVPELPAPAAQVPKVEAQVEVEPAPPAARASASKPRPPAGGRIDIKTSTVKQGTKKITTKTTITTQADGSTSSIVETMGDEGGATSEAKVETKVEATPTAQATSAAPRATVAYTRSKPVGREAKGDAAAAAAAAVVKRRALQEAKGGGSSARDDKTTKPVEVGAEEMDELKSPPGDKKLPQAGGVEVNISSGPSPSETASGLSNAQIALAIAAAGAAALVVMVVTLRGRR